MVEGNAPDVARSPVRGRCSPHVSSVRRHPLPLPRHLLLPMSSSTSSSASPIIRPLFLPSPHLRLPVQIGLPSLHPATCPVASLPIPPMILRFPGLPIPSMAASPLLSTMLWQQPRISSIDMATADCGARGGYLLNPLSSATIATEVALPPSRDQDLYPQDAGTADRRAT